MVTMKTLLEVVLAPANSCRVMSASDLRPVCMKPALMKRSYNESSIGESDDQRSPASDIMTLQSKRAREAQNNHRDSVCVVTRSEMMAYFDLLENPFIFEFLSSDACRLYSDKYLLAMVFAYFKRAEFSEHEYTRINFFVALFLANDMEEDDEDYKFEILPWAMNRDWRRKIPTFLQQRDKLLARIGYRAVVSNRCCEEVMSMKPDHWAWKRQRLAHHAGAVRSYARDLDFYDLRGPYDTPRGPCDKCTSVIGSSVDVTATGEQSDVSWYLSSSSTSSPSELPLSASSSQLSSSDDERESGIKFCHRFKAITRATQHRLNTQDVKKKTSADPNRKTEWAAES